MKIAHEKEIMGRLMVSVLCVFFIVLLSSVPVTSSEVNESVYPCERPYYIETSGLTKTPLRFLLINHMFKPWPDQLYSTMFGIIFYEAGNTTITNTQTSETMQYEGEHIVIFYKFLGPVSKANNDSPTVAFEGNTVYARGLKSRFI
jgi:hypothetical protein